MNRRTTLLATALFTATAAAVALHQPPAEGGATPIVTPTPPPTTGAILPAQRPRIEVVFVLDTTGSMSGLIQAAKDKIWSIASSMKQAQPAPELKIGLVAYRDRGDAYVTQISDLSGDIDTLYGTLMDYQAEGGGDGPESVNQALSDAVQRMSWSQDPNTYRVVFLVGDAPPHMDYQDEVKYPETLAIARRKGIVVNAIQCGNEPATLQPWQQIASLGAGQYFDVDQGGSAVAIATPFDEKLAELSKRLDGTRLYYGDAGHKAKQAAKIAATEKLNAAAPAATLARRGAFNSSVGKDNFLGEQELVDDVASGRVKLDKIAPAALPEPLQAMAPEARAEEIGRLADERKQIASEMQELARQRDGYLKKEVAKSGGAADSLDAQIFDAVKAQAKGAGIEYKEGDGPAY